MRYLTGAVGVIAAALFVGYSAVITWNVAHEMTTEFKELAGWAAAGIVICECLGLLYVRQCWANGSKLIAAGGLALVLAAAVYIARLDLRFHVAGQSDLAASRTAAVENRQMTRDELIKARAQRDTLRAKKKLSGFEREELETLSTRISALEGKFDTQIVNSGGMPEAGWASRMLHKVSDDEVWWQDALMVFGLVFWALARMLAMPLAVASMGSIRKPVQAREGAPVASPAVIAPATASSPVLRDPPAIPVRFERKPLAPMITLPEFKPAEPVSNPDKLPPAPEPDGDGTPAEAPQEPQVQEAAEDTRKVVSLFRDNGQLPEAARSKKKGHKPVAKAASWLADACTQVEGHREKSKDCWKSYQEYCALYGKKELPRNAFSRQLNVLVGQKSGRDRPRNKGGSTFEGIRINPVMAQARRRVA